MTIQNSKIIPIQDLSSIAKGISIVELTLTKIAPDGISVSVIFRGQSKPYSFPQSLHDRDKLRRFVELLKPR